MIIMLIVDTYDGMFKFSFQFISIDFGGLRASSSGIHVADLSRFAEVSHALSRQGLRKQAVQLRAEPGIGFRK